MNGALSDYWVVEYHFHGNAFHVCKLTDYLRQSQNSCNEGKLFCSVIMSIFPNEAGAREECSAWIERRDKNPISPSVRLADCMRYVAGLQAQAERG